ncbi:MAG: hypothetical protein GOV01_02730 [Candidatus Altiarchaeota archaeon]|nr:hypothetical protein [Candidatus Altiarchaeota archaeon]
MSKVKLFRIEPFWLIYGLVLLLFLQKPIAIGWDDSEYLAYGKHIFGNTGYASEYRPPILPLILGALWKIGLPMPETATFFAFLVYISIPLISYFRFKDSRKYLGLLIISHPVFFRYSHSPISHIIASAFIVLSVATPPFLSGVFSILAGLSRFSFFIFAPFSLLYGDWKSRIKGQLLVLITYFAISTFLFKNPLLQFSSASQIINFPGFLWYWAHGPLFYVGILFTFSPFLISILKNKSPATLATIAALVYFSFLPHKEDRFFIDIFVFGAIALSEKFPRLTVAQLIYFIPFLLLIPLPNTTPPELFTSIDDGSSVLGMSPYVNSYKDVEFYAWFSQYTQMNWSVDYCIYSQDEVPCNDDYCTMRVSQFLGNCSAWDVHLNRSGFVIAENPAHV